VPAGYDFVTHALQFGSEPAALLEGTLAVTDRPATGGICLLVVRGSRDVTFVAWPERFTLVLASDGKVEVRGNGRTLRQGDPVQLGGEEISDSIEHSIPGACQAPSYFAVTSFP